jgi:hypothetical protein
LMLVSRVAGVPGLLGCAGVLGMPDPPPPPQALMHSRNPKIAARADGIKFSLLLCDS